MTSERSERTGLGGRLIEGLEARIALLGFELGEERDRFLATVVTALVAVVLLFVGLLVVNALLVLLFWEQRVAVAGVLALLYVGAAVALGLTARSRLRNAPQPFAATLEELSKDADAFRHSGGKG